MHRILPLLLASSLWAADALADFNAAMSDNDLSRKKAAIQGLLTIPAAKDDTVLPLLLGALGDRQAGETAASALSSRLGGTPSGGSFKPGADLAKIQAAWQGAVIKRLQALEIEKVVKAAEDKEKAAKNKKPVVTDEAKPVAEAPKEPKAARAPADDLGKLSRVVFTSGGSLVCFVQTKRTDADGNLLSIRVVHSDGSGEETIAADQIARIEEDAR